MMSERYCSLQWELLFSGLIFFTKGKFMKKLAMVLASAGIVFAGTSFANKPVATSTTTDAAPVATVLPAPVVTTPSSGLNVGVIDVGQVLKNSPQMKAAADNLRKNFKPREEKIMAAQKNLQADQDKLKRNTAVMSQTDIQALQAKITDERRDVQRMQEDYVQDLQAAQQEVMQGVLQQLDKIVQNIAAKGHYDLILQRNSVAFASQRVDITPQVIQSLKQ
jgi:outer membrane protein